MKKRLSVISVFAIMMSCSEESEIPVGCDISKSRYAADIQPIIQNSCLNAGCHGTDRGTGVNFSFTTYDGLKEAAGSISDRINRPLEDPLHMPVGFTLDSCFLYKLNAWLIEGAPNN